MLSRSKPYHVFGAIRGTGALKEGFNADLSLCVLFQVMKQQLLELVMLE